MDILLIDPPYIGLKGISVDRGYNMGLTSLAAYLRRGGVEAAVLTGDLFTETRRGLLRKVMPGAMRNMARYAAGQREYARIVSDPHHSVWKDIAAAVGRIRPGAVGIAYITTSRHSVARVAGLVKGIDRGIKVIAGSFHPTFCPEDVLRNPDIDFVIRGEGEVPLLQLMNGLRQGLRAPEEVPGLSYRDGNGQVKNNPAPAPLASLDEMPFPARDLVLNCDYDFYRLHAVTTTRGCPYTCTFCADRRLWGGKVRRRSAANVIGELRLLKSTYQISYVDIVDGTFTFDRKYLQAFCNALLDEKLDIKWRCTARYDNLDPEILALMRKSGCTGLYFGLESGSDRILKAVDKKITTADIVRVSRMVRDAGILSETSVLLGLPDETTEDIEATLSLMRVIKTDQYDVNSFIPLPGTVIWDAMSDGERQAIDWLKVGYKSYDNYFSKRLTREEFAACRREAYRIADKVLRRTIVRLGARALVRPVAGIFRR